MYTILGAGLSGLSIAEHLAKRNIPFQIYESKSHGGGHIHSSLVNGFTWDEGPHVSFTKYAYVRNYFAENCDHQYHDFSATPANYYQGNWIMHPAQAHMYAIPEPLRTECINDVIAIREEMTPLYTPENYQQWLDYAFGKKFAEVFPKVYTQKYWTTEPVNLTTDWIGKRIYFPEIADMIESAEGQLNKQTHYINTIRYPKKGGFYSFIKKVERSLPVIYDKEITYISFSDRMLYFKDGQKISYEKLISTLPLPELILKSDAPLVIKDSALMLKCSQLLLLNMIIDHSPTVNYQWIYVYDKEFYSTRINFTDLLSSENGITGQCGIQVEVYFSEYHPLSVPIEQIEKQVIDELIKMKLILAKEYIRHSHTKWVNWANVIFDQARQEAQEAVFAWLASVGMHREADDLEPMTDWESKKNGPLGEFILAGRFAQWKYFWTDDCVMRAKYISENISNL